MPRRPITIQRARIGINTTHKVETSLRRLVESGYYGNSVAEAAERLLCEGLRARVKELKLSDPVRSEPRD